MIDLDAIKERNARRLSETHFDLHGDEWKATQWQSDIDALIAEVERLSDVIAAFERVLVMSAEARAVIDARSWVPVSEGPPPQNQWYTQIAYERERDLRTNQIVTRIRPLRSLVNYPLEPEATHWLPLPDPTKLSMAGADSEQSHQNPSGSSYAEGASIEKRDAGTDGPVLFGGLTREMVDHAISHEYDAVIASKLDAVTDRSNDRFYYFRHDGTWGVRDDVTGDTIADNMDKLDAALLAGYLSGHDRDGMTLRENNTGRGLMR